jgi:hypothetical protein
MNPNAIPSTRETLPRVLEPDTPPFAARVGCGLVVAALLVGILAGGVFIYAAFLGYEFLVNAQTGGMDAAKSYLDYLTSIQFQERITNGVMIAGGVIIAGSLIAASEAKNFLLWLRR